MVERPSTHTSPTLSLVWVGMPVTDVTGRLVGWVRSVKPASTAAGLPASPSDEADIARALTETGPTLGPAAAERLAHRGFLKVRGPGLMDNDRYILADQVAVIDEDSVRLSAAAEDLPIDREHWI